MNLEMNGHGCKTSIFQVLMLFFPMEDEINVVSTLEIDGENATVHTEIRHNLKESYASYTEVIDESNDKCIRNIVKKSTLLAAQKISNQRAPWGILTGIRPAKIATDLMREGKSSEEVTETLKDYYWVSPEKADLTLSVAKKEFPILTEVDDKTVGIYLGMPFCPTRCLYCSFVSTSMEYLGKYLKPYLECLEAEIKKTGELIRSLGLKVDSVYFGGGTPTTISASQMDSLLSTLCQEISFDSVKEFTVEAGRPDTLTPEKLAVLKGYPVTRLSINPQSMHQITLDRIGRRHTPEDIIRAYEMAREAGFYDINSDVIAGLPGETPEMFAETLERLTPLSPEGITVHTMYIKRASRLKEQIDEYRATASEDIGKMLLLAEDYTKQNGYEPYYMYKQKNTLGNHENVGYAKPGHESLYNIRMMEEAQTIFGLGGGGVTKIVRDGEINRIFNMKNADEYVNRFDEMLARKEQIREFFE